MGLLAVQDVEAETLNAPAVTKAVDWVLSKEVRVKGDWAVKVPNTEPGGWSFEYENLSYPDVDDTAVGLMVLSRLRNKPEWREKGVEDVLERAKEWVFGMQSDNGGWGAFDKDNSKPILTKIPFSDFGEAIDPPSVDVTAHVLEGLGLLDYGTDHPKVRRGLDFIKERQREDGSWFGRWGVNYVYGTGAVLARPACGRRRHETTLCPQGRRLAARHAERRRRLGRDLHVLHGPGPVRTLPGEQRFRHPFDRVANRMGPHGSGRGRPSGRRNRPSGAASTFCSRHRTDGTWDEPEFTGTGFPGYGFGDEMDFNDPAAVASLKQGRELGRGFMINYHMYRHYFPMMAMGRARKYLAKNA